MKDAARSSFQRPRAIPAPYAHALFLSLVCIIPFLLIGTFPSPCGRNNCHNTAVAHTSRNIHLSVVGIDNPATAVANARDSPRTRCARSNVHIRPDCNIAPRVVKVLYYVNYFSKPSHKKQPTTARGDRRFLSCDVENPAHPQNSTTTPHSNASDRGEGVPSPF